MLPRVCVLTFAILSTAVVGADDQQPTGAVSGNSDAGIAFFESKIRPVLIKHCYDCHSLEADTAEGGLRVDDRPAIRSGGGRGVAIVPGKPDASILLTAISHADADLKMPPKEQRLPDEVLFDFKKWIEMGAPDPRDGEATSSSPEWTGGAAAKEHWAYLPVSPSPPPAVADADADWSRSPIDPFILAKLRESHLEPSSDAPPHVLLRRVHFDLVGLPPSPDDIDRFTQACQSQGVDAALAEVVDDLLASPRFGERWGRHWLDVARFGESTGKEANLSYPYAWRYRDYVIDSINADVPYDRFLTEQIAGDLLPADSDRERARQLVATGYLAIGTKNVDAVDEKQFAADIIDEQIDALTRAVMASSVACARCHHHKFDPFSMEDYYALAGIFTSTKSYFGTFVSPSNRQSGDLLVLPRLEDEVILNDPLPVEKVRELQQNLAELKAEKAEMDAALMARFAGKKPEKEFTLTQVLSNIWRTGPIEGKLETIDDDGNALPVAMGVLDREVIVDAPLMTRGEVNRPGDTVPRGFPPAIDVGEPIPLPSDQSGRLQLAHWLTDPQHPLTSRVFVNRVWHHVFGSGLVATVDNFGTTGEPPSHPELLDTLAAEFMADGWSLKKLVRHLVLSRTYRQDSAYDAEAFVQDPDNRLLWRMPKRRLEAEAIRDAMLAASGEIDFARPQGSLVGKVIGDRPISLIGLDARLPKDLDGTVQRSVYLPVIRDRLPDVLELFDFAEPSLVTGDREITNVPLQALYLMNSPFVRARAAGLASRLARETDNDTDRIRTAFRLCYGREPDELERERSLAFLQGPPVENDEPADAEQPPTDEDTRLVSFCQALLSTAEFRNID